MDMKSAHWKDGKWEIHAPPFDESAIYHDTRRPSMPKMGLWFAVGLVAACILLYAGHVRAQKAKVGQTVIRELVICSQLVDAEMFLAKLKDIGQDAALAWTQDPKNSCSWGLYQFIIGEPVGQSLRVEGKTWILIRVYPEERTRGDYAIVPESTLDLSMNYI